MKRILALIIIVIAIASSHAAAQTEPLVQAQVRLDRVQITVGDLLTYELRVIGPSDLQLELPPMPETNLGEWEVRSCTTLAASNSDTGQQLQGWTCELTIWETGYHALPTQIVRYTAADNSQARATTQPIAVQVASVLDENPSDIKPLKPQLIMTEQLNYLLILGITLLSILVLSFLVWAYFYYQRHRPVRLAPVPAAPTLRDPVMVALEELNRIAHLNLVQQDRIVDHYTLISDVLRQFIASRFSIPALERTTGEVHMQMSHPGLLRKRDTLLSLLAQSDGVKFARRLPTHNQAYELLEHARQAILATN